MPRKKQDLSFDFALRGIIKYIKFKLLFQIEKENLWERKGRFSPYG